MILDWAIAGHARSCAACQRELHPGEPCRSALIDDRLGLRRVDHCLVCWSGAPEGAFCWWRTRVPEPSRPSRPRPRADRGLLLDLLRRLEGDRPPQDRDLRYVVALMLLRMKVLEFQDTRREQGGRSLLVLVSRREGEPFLVEDPGLSGERIDQVREALLRLVDVGG
ncbi:MAG: hypothetical protein HY722_15980 [Planctomycetes bacterium]|nr:hypothetical protein [Planctomycetota bacterium]